ncbi:MAG: dihydrofolate reductase family protein, partial [Acidobacteriota bacterium]
MRADAVKGPVPLEVFFDAAPGENVSLPPALERAYGRLSFPVAARPYVIANFVETLDGVVSLGIPGRAGGGPISGANQSDRMVMGLLRAVADAVVVGAGTLRSVPNHIWTHDYIFPPLADEYAQLRSQLGKPPHPLNVIVSSSGALDANYAIFKQTQVPTLVLTTTRGAEEMKSSTLRVDRTALTDAETIPSSDILRALTDRDLGDLVLLEGGPQLMGVFLAERAVDELFLTLAPQVAG